MVVATDAASRVHVRTEKRKASVRMVKPGDATVAARHTAPWMASSLPRAIRNRVPSRKVKPGKVSPVSPGSPHQKEVVNTVTGKRALGPWSGPFKSHPAGGLSELLLPETLFMDDGGAAHLGLDVEEHHKLLRALQEAQESNASNVAAPMDIIVSRSAGQLTDPKRVQAKRQHELESSSRASRQKFPSMRQQRALLRRDSQINQPRRFYYSNTILKNAKAEQSQAKAAKKNGKGVSVRRENQMNGLLSMFEAP